MSQFKDEGKFLGLEHLISVPSDVYAVGRLDATSEGLLVLTNDKRLNQKMLHPDSGKEKVYLVQVEGDISPEAIRNLENGVRFKAKGKELVSGKAKCKKVEEPDWLWERNPPVRERKNIPTSWIKLTIKEGKNRQVRRMTAGVGYPTLRLVRIGVANLTIEGVNSGELQEVELSDIGITL